LNAVVEVIKTNGSRYDFSTEDDLWVTLKDGAVIVWKGDPNDPVKLEGALIHRAFGPGQWDEIRVTEIT
jgi:hypothetical protein